MDLETLPLISADSHVEEPSGLWRENLPASMIEKLPPELSPDSRDYHAATQFAKRIGIEQASEAKALTEAAVAAGAAPRSIAHARLSCPNSAGIGRDVDLIGVCSLCTG